MKKSFPKELVSFLFVVSISIEFLFADFIESTPVGMNIIHHHEFRAAGPWHIHVLEIDRTVVWNQLETVKANDALYGNETTSSMATRSDYEAHRVVGAVNADFYATGGIPIGAQIIDGILLKRPYPRSVFGSTLDKLPLIDIVSFQGAVFAANDSALIVNGINEDRGNDQLIMYNKYFGSTTQTNQWGAELTVAFVSDQPLINDTARVIVVAKDSIQETGHGNNAIPANGVVLSGHGSARDFLNEHIFVGDTIAFILSLPPTAEPLVELVGGTPRLIRNGVATVEWQEESVLYSFTHDRHPRTAVGFSQDSTRIYFFTVDGRQSGYSVGMSLFELADYMLEWDIYQGVNLDGGGSTTMVVRGQVANSPSDGGGERAVANALMIISTAPTGPLAILKLAPRVAYVVVAAELQFSVSGFDQYYNPVSATPDSLIWSCDSTIGTIDESGLFTAGAEHNVGYVYVNQGSIRDSAQVYITDITAIALLPNPIILQVGQQQMITAEARDSYNNIINLSAMDYQWAVAGQVGTVSASGLFTATQPGDGHVIATYHSVTGSTAVSVGVSTEVILDDFATVNNWSLTGVLVELAACSLTVDTSILISQPSSAQLDYSLTTGGTSALYLNGSIPVSGTPDAVGIYLYGDGKGHWLRGEFEDADGEKFLVDFTSASPGINWTDSWQYLEIPFSEAIIHWGDPNAVLTFPITWKKIYLVETNDANKDAGTIYLDDFKVLFTSLKINEAPNPAQPDRFGLEQNFPNPFNPTTTIQYSVSQKAKVEISVFDILGRTIETLVSKEQTGGNYSLQWNVGNRASGIYFYSIKVEDPDGIGTGDFIHTRKMIVMR